MSTKSHQVLTVALAAGLLAGCSNKDFDESAALQQLQAAPVELDGEQVTLTRDQVACGERDDLWVVLPESGNRAVGRLTDRGRALGFSDDLHIGDPGMNLPYGQIRGNFSLHASDTHIQDVDERTKIVDAKIGVVLDHGCLKRPAPALMGLHHGRFSTVDNPTFQFRRHGDTWQLDGLVH